MPNLATTSRARPPRFKSRAQMEEEEIANMPKFTAKPFRHAKRRELPLADMPSDLQATDASTTEQVDSL